MIARRGFLTGLLSFFAAATTSTIPALAAQQSITYVPNLNRVRKYKATLDPVKRIIRWDAIDTWNNEAALRTPWEKSELVKPQPEYFDQIEYHEGNIPEWVIPAKIESFALPEKPDGEHIYSHDLEWGKECQKVS